MELVRYSWDAGGCSNVFDFVFVRGTNGLGAANYVLHQRKTPSFHLAVDETVASKCGEQGNSLNSVRSSSFSLLSPRERFLPVCQAGYCLAG
jgi:hypothetical protein